MAMCQIPPARMGAANPLSLVGGMPGWGSQCWCHLHPLCRLLLGLWKESQEDLWQKILLGHCDHPGLEEEKML